MSRPVVRLVERRTRPVSLPRADARFLADHFPHVVEVTPGFARHRFRLAARGHVGFVDGPSRRFEIAPKVPWAAVLHLLGLTESRSDGDTPVEPGTALLGMLGRELAGRMTAVARTGLVRGYHEADAESVFLRGRLRTAEQLRDAARGRPPDLFHVLEDAFDLDTPWNRIPANVARWLAAHPDVAASVRDALAVALVPFDGVSNVPISPADFDAAYHEPRAAGYNDLITLCRTVWESLTAAGTGGGRGAFLFDLGRAFERYVTEAVTASVADRPLWSVESQSRFPLGDAVVLQPDVVVRRGGSVRAVLDAKWKRPGPDAADLHQILAYAAVTGTRHVALVYPGRRFARKRLAVPHGNLGVSLVRVPLAGDVGDRLARLIVRRG